MCLLNIFVLVSNLPIRFNHTYLVYIAILQLGLFLKKILKDDIGCLSTTQLVEAISLYLNQKSSLASKDFSKFCICGGKLDRTQNETNYSCNHAETINNQQKELEV